MIYPSIESVEDFIHELIDSVGEGESWDHLTVKVSLNDNTYTIHIERMYEYVTVNFAFLSKVSEYFGTKNINDERYSHGGCETCDYGSSYQVTLTVKE